MVRKLTINRMKKTTKKELDVWLLWILFFQKIPWIKTNQVIKSLYLKKK